MKSIFSDRRFSYLVIMQLIIFLLIIFLLIISCNDHSVKERPNVAADDTTAAAIAYDSLNMKIDTSATLPDMVPQKDHQPDRSPASVPDEKEAKVTAHDRMKKRIDTAATFPDMVPQEDHHPDKSPIPAPERKEIAKGTAMVYCPTKMIRDVPSIVNAVISRDELSVAFTKFSEKIQQQNTDIKKENITRDIKGDTIDLYKKMGVTIEFDPADFKQISKDENLTKQFENKNTLEWEWVLKPLQSTRKSIIDFRFYYIDPNTDSTNYILEKTISIAVKVDARSYIDKWKDFLLDDPKTTITAILIPLFTFIGGFLTGKKKKKE